MTAAQIVAHFPGCADLSVRTLQTCGRKASLLYFENICDRRFLHEYILRPLLLATDPETNPEDVITCGALSYHTEVQSVVQVLLTGEAVVISGERVISVKVQSELARGVSEPETETVIRGPREGFTERAGNNAALLRRRIRSPHLKYEVITLGKKTAAMAVLMYLDDVVNRKALALLRQRLDVMDTDAVIDSGELELWLEQSLCPLFPTVGNSERPDKVAAKILEGRIALIVDGTPVVLTLPYLFVESLQSTEDYGKSMLYAGFVRCLRFASLLLAVYLPSVFLALFLYHPNAIPEKLYQKILETRQSVPFSLFVELLLTLFAFEMIREVAIRMPRTVGSAVGLVAALILGDSAISAGITSAPVIIVVAFTAIGNFLVPPYMNTAILLRIGFLVAARFAGLFGVGMASVGMLIHLCAKSSFGVPYFSPFAPISVSGLLDFLIVAPPWGMKKIPPSLTGLNRTRNQWKSRSDRGEGESS